MDAGFSSEANQTRRTNLFFRWASVRGETTRLAQRLRHWIDWILFPRFRPSAVCRQLLPPLLLVGVRCTSVVPILFISLLCCRLRSRCSCLFPSYESACCCNPRMMAMRYCGADWRRQFGCKAAKTARAWLCTHNSTAICEARGVRKVGNFHSASDRRCSSS